MRGAPLAAAVASLTPAVAGLSACASDDGGTTGSSTTSAGAPAPSPTAVDVVQEDVDAVPLARGSAYNRAVATFGAEEVTAAAITAGNDLAADARRGCDGSAPLRHHLVRASVGNEDPPRILVDGEFSKNVRPGSTLVAAGQDWAFTVELPPTGGGSPTQR